MCLKLKNARACILHFNLNGALGCNACIGLSQALPRCCQKVLAPVRLHLPPSVCARWISRPEMKSLDPFLLLDEFRGTAMAPPPDRSPSAGPRASVLTVHKGVVLEEVLRPTARRTSQHNESLQSSCTVLCVCVCFLPVPSCAAHGTRSSWPPGRLPGPPPPW